MSNISQKLTYLNETKSQLKDMINYGLPTENQITNETTFRNYVKGIFEAFIESLRDSTTLYTNLPKISGNGTQITLNDTANAPMRITLKASELTQDATPTPDTPQDIHTISGDNSVVVNGKNLFDKDNANVISAYFRDTALNQLVINSSNSNKTIIYKGEPNTTYTISKTLGNRFRVGLYNSMLSENGTYTFSTSAIRDDTATSITITTTSTNYYIYVQIFETGNLQNTLDTIMIEKGSTATTYEPYVSQTAPINLDTIEYCKIGNYEDEFIRSDGRNIFNDTLELGNINQWGNASSTTAIRCVGYTEIQEQTTYTISSTSTINFAGIQMFYYNANKEYLSATWLSSGTFTTPSNAKYLRFKVNDNTNTTQLIQIELGNQATEYTPYTKGWYLKKNIGKVVLDGTESWNERTNSSGIKQFYAPTNLPVNSVLNATQICTHFNKYVQNLFNYGGVGQFAILTNTRQFIAGVEDTLLLADFKTSLASNNLIVYYVLSTPTYTQITGTLETQLNNIYEKLLSYKGTTNISQVNNDLPFVLGVSAIQDLE